MNKLNFFSSAILFLIILITAQNSIYAQKQDETRIKGIDLSKKVYYEQIFTKDERKQLKKANSYLDDAKKYMLDYKLYQKDIDNLYTIAKATSNAKTTTKSLSKARKLEKKLTKSGNKSIENYNKGTDIKSNVYTTALNRTRLNENSTYAQAGKELESNARSNYEKAREKARSATSNDPVLKLKTLFEANNLTLDALAYQENAFAVYTKDPGVNPDDFYFKPDTTIKYEVVNTDKDNNVVKVDSILFPLYIDKYDPNKDPNMYHLQLTEILRNLKLTQDEQKMLADASRKNQYANDLQKQVDQTYMVIDSLNFAADRTKDFALRDRLRNSAIEMEQQAFFKLMNATNIYLDVNDTRYKIYKAHFPQVDPKKMTPDLEEAKKSEKEAEEYYLRAQNEISEANRLTFQSEQYMQKMSANEKLLYALQLQENAYGIYQNLKDKSALKPGVAPGKDQVVKTTKSEKSNNDQAVSAWAVSNTYTYSKEKPKATPYKVKNGVVFLVQLGVFKGIIPPDKFGTIQPIVYDEFTNNSNRRFMAGEYRSSEAAEISLGKIKNMGYTDAYIVALVNGQRKSYSAGKDAINANDQQYKQSKNTELAKLSGKEVQNEDETYEGVSDNESGIGKNVKNTNGLVYFVQLGMFKNPISEAQLKNLQPIFTDKIPGKGTRYMMGSYSTIARARQESQKAINKGFKDAYVIAYYNGEHIALDKAKRMEGSQGNVVEEDAYTPSGKVVYMVQIGAYRDKLTTAEENKLRAQFSNRNVETRLFEQMNLYLVGNYGTYKEADLLKKKLLNEGHEGLFVVAFNGSEKISVDEAMRLNNNK